MGGITERNRSYSNLIHMIIQSLFDLSLQFAGFWCGVAICAIQVSRFRSCQYAATIAVLINLPVNRYLRPKSDSTVAVQKCPNRSNALWKLEIGQTTKKYSRIGSLPAAFLLNFQAKRPQRGGREWCKSGHDGNRNSRSRAIAPLTFGPEQRAPPHPQPVQPVLAPPSSASAGRTWCCGGS